MRSLRAGDTMYREFSAPGSSGDGRATTLILVASGNTDIRERICRYLLRAGYTVSAATDDETALGLMRATAYDLVVLDSAMAGAGVRNFLKAVRDRKIGTDPPAILALIDDRDRTPTGYVGDCPDGLLSKTVRMDALVSKVEAELAHRRPAPSRSLGTPAFEGRPVEIKPGKSDGGLAATKRVLADALEAIHDGVVLWDAGDRLVICNKGFRRLFGDHARYVVAGARFADLMQLQLESGALRVATSRRSDWLADRLSCHRSPNGCCEDEYADGTWVRVTENRTPGGYTVGIYTEISQIKRRETALKISADSNRRLASAVDAAGSAILITDPRRPGNPTIFANPAFANTTGWPVEEALGRDRSFLNGPETDLDEVARFEGEMIAGRAASAELLLKARNGRQFWAEVSASPIRGSDGRIANWVIVQTDVTVRKKTAQRPPRPTVVKPATPLARYTLDDFAGLLVLAQDHLETALKARGLAKSEARIVFEAVIDAARQQAEMTQPTSIRSGQQSPAATVIDSRTVLPGYK